MSNQTSRVIGKEYIDEIKKIDDAVANILSKLDVAASSTPNANNNYNKDNTILDQDNFNEVYRKLLFTLTHNSEFVIQMGINSFHINPQEIEQIINASKNHTINTLNEISIINSLEDEVKRLRRLGNNKASEIASKELDELMKKYNNK
ncbi:MAG: hypothetical protein JO297_14210 [Nitrososphaeraceae archaeon]|nr:hypothetical protein [Nitrososphaeraceae archaeon]